LPGVHEGDVVFHTSRSSQSFAIQEATHSPYSHMGIVIVRGGRPYVFEAVSTTRYTPLRDWLRRGAGRHYVIKRLRDADQRLTADALNRLESTSRRFEGRPYDLTFEWSDDRMYCSELVWKIYDRALGVQLGAMQHLRDFDLSAPEVRAKMRERYGDHVPLDEPVISPVAIFSSDQLVTVAER
jgi:hypothetical protein